MKGALLEPSNLPARLVKSCLFDAGMYIDATVGSLEFGRHSVPNHMHDSSCHAASCGCQERPTGVFARGPRLLFKTPTPTPPQNQTTLLTHVHTHTHTYIKTPCAPHLPPPHCTSLCIPLPTPPPFRLHATLIINDLRDSFHLIYYLGWDSGCCAAASLLDL